MGKKGISFGYEKKKAVLERDGNKCWLCGGEFGQKGELLATLDHVIPRFYGGFEDIENLKLAHRKCNRERGAPKPDFTAYKMNGYTK